MKVLVAGRSGQVARALLQRPRCEFEFVAMGRPLLDLKEPLSIARAIEAVSPVAIVNAAAYTAVDRAESEAAEAFAINTTGAGELAAQAALRGLPIVHLSTDYVFPGDAIMAYREDDPVGPRNVYGVTKLAGERAVAAANPAHVILRTAWIHSPFGTNFVRTMLALARERDAVRVVADQQGTPTYAFDVADGILAVLRKVTAAPRAEDWPGIFHLTAAGQTTWAGFASEIFAVSRRSGGPSAEVHPIVTAGYSTAAVRPVNSHLSSARFKAAYGLGLPDWREGCRRCVEQILRGDEPAAGAVAWPG